MVDFYRFRSCVLIHEPRSYTRLNPPKQPEESRHGQVSLSTLLNATRVLNMSKPYSHSSPRLVSLCSIAMAFSDPPPSYIPDSAVLTDCDALKKEINTELMYNPDITSDAVYNILGPDWGEQTRDGKPVYYCKRLMALPPDPKKRKMDPWPKVILSKPGDFGFRFPDQELNCDHIATFVRMYHQSRKSPSASLRTEAKLKLEEAEEFCNHERNHPCPILELPEKSAELREKEAEMRTINFLLGVVDFAEVLTNMVTSKITPSYLHIALIFTFCSGLGSGH
jgi:hypothetical protein